MLSLIKATIREFREDEAPRLAAALSYYTVFSLPPLMILLFLIAGAIWDPQDVQGALVDEVGGAIGSDAAEQIRGMIQNADRTGQDGLLMTVLSIAGLVFGATGAFGELQAALNRAWEVRKDPEKGGILAIVLKRMLSFGMILVIGFLLLVSLALSALLNAAGSTIASYLPRTLGEAALYIADLGLSIFVITVLFAAIFKVLPDAKVAWADVWRGAFVTALLFVAGKFLLGLYIGRSDPGSAFGAAGSLAVILVWVYYSAMILLLGAEFTQVYADRHGRGIQPDAGALRFDDRRVTREHARH